MRDPYDVLGIKQGTSFNDVKAAYRRACKTKHPDMGGSREEFVELQAAYEAILKDLKQGYQARHEEAPRADATTSRGEDRKWEQAYRDIDDELEEIRRNAWQRDEALRAMRTQAWEEGNHVAWARLTWQDVRRFFVEIMRSGIKGIALLCAALIGLGSVLVEANAVSAIIMLGGGLGFVFSQALKSDKGGMLSAGLLLFGIMTIWLPSVRGALIHYPLATLSLLLCLALIFKFGQQGGIVGLLTGGVLTLFVVGAVISQTPQLIPVEQPSAPPPDRTPAGSKEPISESLAPPTPEPHKPAQPEAPHIRELIASKGAVLKLVSGVEYRLKIRGGFTTSLVATRGSFAESRDAERITACLGSMTLSAPRGSTPYGTTSTRFRACGSDAVVTVLDVE